MYSLIKYIHNIFNSYDSCSDFYSRELSMYLSMFEVLNFIILCFILFIIFIRCLIIRYTLKRIFFFLFKRFFFFLFFLLLVTLLSNPIYCENSGISKLFDTNTKKACIATLAITGCYLSYKYVPIYYKTVISHKNYIDYLKNKQQYGSESKEYSMYLEYLDKLDKQKSLTIEYNSNLLLFNNLIKHYSEYLTNFVDSGNFNLIFNDLRIVEFNSNLNKVKLKMISEGINIDTTDLDSKLVHIFNNFINNGVLVKELIDSDIKYKINKSVINYQNMCFTDLDNLIFFYKKKLNIITDLDSNMCINLVKELNLLLNKTKLSSDLMYSNFLTIKKSEMLVKPLDITSNIYINYKKPIEPEPINFPLENLEGLRYIGINLGYVVFYPILYSSNKILGTYNPLSNQSFIDAISYLISLIKFF